MAKRYIAILVFLAIFIVGMYYWRGLKSFHKASGVVWTTEYNITYESREPLDDSIQAVLDRVDNSASKYNKSSVISRINDNSNLQVDDIVRRLYEKSAEVNRITEGAFDPTVSPLANVWGFGLRNNVEPDSAAIDSIKAFVGFTKTSLRGDKIVKNDSRTTFDFNSIAKGLACDEVGRMLVRNGVENYIVEIGGEIAVLGLNEQGRTWLVSVDKPIESADEVIHQSAFVLEVGDGGVATSGNYRNFRMVDGRKVAHTINPRSGYPEMTNLLSVTIVAPDCMTADAYATGCMVLGVDNTKRLLGDSSEIAVSITYLDDNGNSEVWNNALFTKKYLVK